MKLWIFLFFCCLNCFCQEAIIKNATKFVGVDIYENCYYLQNDALHKSGLKNDYKNVEYGIPDVVDISNPLQILLLYKFFNKVILLDNQLSFITQFEVPIGTELISNASKDKIWLYDNINMMIKLYNFKTQKTEISSIPIKENIVELKGNLNQALVLDSKNQLTKYNFLARKEDVFNTENIILPKSLIKTYYIKERKLYHKNNETLSTPSNIESFEVINNKLYFFKENNIYALPIPKN
ncbi:hypothetical protein [Wenyingzhuangia fucanilytica]|nr:hypothetical protein [Wenyingzhuangia fucanilytica]